MSLRTDFALGAAGDDVYETLVAAHEGLDFEMSARLNAALALLLANHVGDRQVVAEAIAAARRSLNLDAKPADPPADA